MREVTKPEVTITEDITSVTSYYYIKEVQVNVQQLKDEVVVDPDTMEETTIKVPDESISTESTTIEGDYYRALMSGNPSWATGKPEGEYRLDDLWVCVDAIADGTVLDIGVET